MVKAITIALVVTSIAIAGIFVFLEIPKTQNSVIHLSATVETTPGNVKSIRQNNCLTLTVVQYLLIMSHWTRYLH